MQRGFQRLLGQKNIVVLTCTNDETTVICDFPLSFKHDIIDMLFLWMLEKFHCLISTSLYIYIYML